MKRGVPLLVERLRIEPVQRLQHFLARHRWRDFQICRRHAPDVPDAFARDPAKKLVLELSGQKT